MVMETAVTRRAGGRSHPTTGGWRRLGGHQIRLCPGPTRVFSPSPRVEGNLPARPPPPPNSPPAGARSRRARHLPKRWARQAEAVSEGSPRSEAATGMLSCKRSTAQGRH